MRLLTSLVFLILACSQIVAQVSFTATADAKQILQGSYVTVEFTLNNAKEKQFTPPDFAPFTVVNGPSTSSRMQFVNGRKTSSKSYSYTLQGNKIGRHRIGAATITAGREKLKTDPITIEVVKASKQKQGAKGGQQYYVELQVSDSTAYVGQQIVLDYVLYTQVDVNQHKINDDFQFDGFYAEEIAVRRGYNRQIINGQEYYERTLQSIALFPQQVGTYTIDPVNVTLGIPTGRRRGFFQDITQRNVLADGVNIKVANAPSGAPESFSGGVGTYTANAQSAKRNLSTDDAITINLTVRGDGDGRFVNPPSFTIPDGLELYEPNTIQDKTEQVNGVIRSTKVFEYLIVPERPGNYEIQPKFSYIDPDSNAYVTLRMPRIQYHITKGTGVAQKVIESEDKVEIGPISETTTLRRQRASLFGTPLYFVLLGLLGAAITGLWFYRQRLVKSGAFDTAVQRKKKAKLKVIKELDDELATVGQNGKARIEVMSNKFNSYITQKFSAEDKQYTDQQIKSILTENGIATSDIDKAITFLSKSKMAIYAGVNADKHQQLYNTVVSLIESIDEQVTVV